jgi:hypothetical protein
MPSLASRLVGKGTKRFLKQAVSRSSKRRAVAAHKAITAVKRSGGSVATKVGSGAAFATGAAIVYKVSKKNPNEIKVRVENGRVKRVKGGK